MKTIGIILLSIVMVAAIAPMAVADRVLDPGEGFANEIIVADTLADGSRANTTYIFKRGGEYYLNGQIANTGWPMTLKAEDGEGALPRLLMWPNADGNLSRHVDASDDAYLYNLYFDGMGPNLATGDPDPLYIMSGQELRAAAAGKELVVDGCILNNSGQVHIRSNSGARKLEITNCIFTNHGQPVRDNLGNGRAFDIRNGATDSLIVRNTTFANGIDRLLRHLDSSGSPAGILGYCEFDHVTIVDWMGTFGMFMLGDLGEQGFKMTNCLWVNPQTLGYDPADVWRPQEWNWSQETDENGIPVFYMITDEPNEGIEPKFEIHHNVISYESSVVDFFNTYGISKAPTITKRIESKLDPTLGTPFIEADVTLTQTAGVMMDLMVWYRTNIENGAITTDEADINRRSRAFWSDSLDCSYTSDNVALVGSDGLPVGDTNWNSVITSVETKSSIPVDFALSQNYPNPFNPVTTINFSLDKTEKTTLTVYNTLGGEVALLVNGRKDAGSYNVSFDASQLTSGVYFYTLKTETKVVSKKMVLIK